MPIRRTASVALAFLLLFLSTSFVFAQDAVWLARATGATAPATPTARDAEIARAVGTRIRAVPGFSQVTATVTGGVVRLEGSVGGEDDRAHAEQIAAQQPGVVRVSNQLQIAGSVSTRLKIALQQVGSKLIGLVARLPLLLVAALIVLFAWWVGRTVSRRIHLSRFSANNPYIDALVARLINWIILLVGLVIALDLMEATAIVGALLGSAGVAGIAIGFAFRDIAENYVAGILLSLRRGFSPGDHILVDKYEGKVVALTSRSTILMTFDGVQVAVPNALVFKSVVSNYSQNPKRRFEFAMLIDVNESIRESQEIAIAAITQTKGVLADPAPSWSVDGYLSGGIQLKFQGWVSQRDSDLGKVRSEALRAVKSAYEKAEIDGPRPVQYSFSAPLPPDIARRIGMAVTPPPDNEPKGGADTSVNRDIDAQVDAQRAAHDDENLI
ncbi:BON domain-containing protein [Lysobacter sp. TY2-98]|uniref:mechanosensitive ion channel domain-containing protein n=1 Tax=Lysobacter sp. TY2-98 TaxID=2290922 RepID=UPI000E1FF0EE|nr:mechanosensitive ion channel domain-containing protein [Lysobacter sp. TY2-98]AXK71611.1 BON domain-containing protein [Lysobacter sp. TY2-98]